MITVDNNNHVTTTNKSSLVCETDKLYDINDGMCLIVIVVLSLMKTMHIS